MNARNCVKLLFLTLKRMPIERCTTAIIHLLKIAVTIKGGIESPTHAEMEFNFYLFSFPDQKIGESE